MPLPIAPNEEARQECLGRLRQIADRLAAKDVDVTLADVDRAQLAALDALFNLLGGLNMTDVKAELARIIKWAEA